ncbi:hypothetical protein ACFYVL_14115 [Streptomyces sp. NPDC004111]|uniref:hypothetical protein n=1 Tax=Streptomyces sp. NPDC004111 TaxID=3364690 RepID=UPI0036C1C6A4
MQASLLTHLAFGTDRRAFAKTYGMNRQIVRAELRHASRRLGAVTNSHTELMRLAVIRREIPLPLPYLQPPELDDEKIRALCSLAAGGTVEQPIGVELLIAFGAKSYVQVVYRATSLLEAHEALAPHQLLREGPDVERSL